MLLKISYSSSTESMFQRVCWKVEFLLCLPLQLLVVKVAILYTCNGKDAPARGHTKAPSTWQNRQLDFSLRFHMVWPILCFQSMQILQYDISSLFTSLTSPAYSTFLTPPSPLYHIFESVATKFELSASHILNHQLLRLPCNGNSVLHSCQSCMSLKEFGVELLSRILLGLIVNVLSVSCVRGEVLYCEKEKEVLAGQWFNIQ